MRIFEYRNELKSQRSNSHVTPKNKICKIKGITKNSPETIKYCFIVRALALYRLSTKLNGNLFIEQPPYS